MNLPKILDHITGTNPEQRRFGKTRAAVALTKSVGGVLLCHNRVYASQVAREYGVDTDSIQTFDPRADRRPIVIDQDAFVSECYSLLTRINHLEADNRKLLKERDEANELLRLLLAIKRLLES